ncbi:MAG TPA: cupin domain-containing protein [Candidatus Bathyarchaeia archaeon]|nr:cupin domain-containing protein [Candidatus Bathyarchaeia archaeon]
MSEINLDSDLPKVEILEELINYQEGSVVSRQIIKQKTGNVTLFAFAKDEGLSEHTAPFDALVYILDGNAIVTIAEKEYHIKTGEFIIMPANIPHALKAIEQFKMLLIMIKEG